MEIACVWAEGDIVTHAIGLVLAAMSIISWTVIVLKLVQLWRVQRITQRTEAQFWNATDYASGLQARCARCRTTPYAALAGERRRRGGSSCGQRAAVARPPRYQRMDHARAEELDRRHHCTPSGAVSPHWVRSAAWRPSSACSVRSGGSITRCCRSVRSGQASLDKVAGPVGEALIMGGLRPVRRDPGGARLQHAEPRQQGFRYPPEPLCPCASRLARHGRPHQQRELQYQRRASASMPGGGYAAPAAGLPQAAKRTVPQTGSAATGAAPTTH